MNKGVANLYRYAQVSQRANDRYRRGSRLSTTWVSARGNWIEVARVSFQGRRRRGLQPLSRDDQALFRPCCGVNTPWAAFAMVRWPNGCTVRDRRPRRTAQAVRTSESQDQSARAHGLVASIRACGATG